MNFAIIVAAGEGKRMNKKANKAFIELLGMPIIYLAIKPFEDCALVDEIIIVARKSDVKKIFKMRDSFGLNKIKKIVNGGKERQDSVYNGLVSIKNAADGDIIIVHNGCNPMVREIEIEDCINASRECGAAAAGFKLKDTLKKAKNGIVEKTIERADVYQMQTPQALKYGLFSQAYRNARKKKIKATDDVSLAEAIGAKVRIVPCSYENIKITTQDDLAIAEGILMKRKNAGGSFRIGFGHDSHKFSAKAKPLVLAGYHVQNETGLEANSDGDVILHALFNAISSAMGGTSIGSYADKMCRNGITDSKEYLKVVIGNLSKKGLRINNISISVEAAKPKLQGHSDKIKNSLSKIAGLDEGSIGIAYTSGEGITQFGQGKGIQCFAVVSLESC